ncbi:MULTISPECIES: glutamate--tRNA ligase [unclassified Helicobacter]|uniref:glutamate--tRNA ligase n=1 Tax=unclassified Helicobacter TaxID=2593540 RepID=UPI000CF18CD3|nr:MULTISPECIES: glutamate--tRNA ligase [unclassified Helicobacter]
MKKIVTRFAPSPTGHLHIGGLRTALFNYLHSKANQGDFYLRIEDTDLTRNSKEAAQAIIEAFDWVGLKFDNDIIYQSQRFDLYQQYIQKLLDEKKAYYCYMSKEELEALRKEQESKKQTPRYDNRYRDFQGTPPSGISPVVRIKAPLEGTIDFEDGVKGKVSFQATEVDDFIIARSDGTPTYNFVVAVDDALMGITDVIRGDDHLSNTPKQIVVYQALGFEIPKFYHVPMILGSDGSKLSKRHGATSVIEYKKMGYLPEALLNFLVRLGWSYQDEEIFSLKDMLEKFSANNLNSSPSCYNQEKFLWLNQYYIRQLSHDALEKELVNFGIKDINPKIRDVLFNEIKNRSHTLLEFRDNINDILTAPTDYDAKMFAKCTSETKQILQDFYIYFEKEDVTSLDNIQTLIHNFTTSKNIKIGNLMPNLRLALLGKPGGIGVMETCFILGKEESLKRLEKLIKAL